MGTDVSEGLRLQVAGARNEDVGKPTVRMDEKSIEALQLKKGGIAEIEGKRRTAAVVLPAYVEDEGLGIVRMDGLQRTNAGVGIGDAVQIRRAGDVKPAKRVRVAPAQKDVRLMGDGNALRNTLQHRPLVAGDTISTSTYRRSRIQPGQFPEDVFRSFLQQPSYGLQEIRLCVVSTTPKGVVLVDANTEIELMPEYVPPQDGSPEPGVTYDDVGGLGNTVDQVREMIELPLKHPELFDRLGIDPPKGVLLHGPPGTGKTLIARAVAHESNASFFSIAGPEIMGKYHGESEQRLRDMFEKAREQAPSIIFIDELDSIAPKRSEVTGEVERRVVAQLLTLMDGLERRGHVVVIGATNRVDTIDEALRRPGRFDREIVIGVPDQTGRREILDIHTRGMPLSEDVDLEELARSSYGFVGADLSAVVREAAIESLRRELPRIDLEEPEIPAEVLERLQVTRDDFLSAFKRIQPSAMREIMIQAPDVRWEDVGGLQDAIRSLRDGIELPLRHPEAFRRLGIRPAKGFLLYGPPGTGKTLLAKAVAREAEANFIASKSSDLLSKWYGESEQQVSRLFQRARQVAPTVIFIDEIDALAPQRGGGLGEPAVTERVVNTILAEMDGLEENQQVVVIGATNQPRLMDAALLRPGRLDELIYVPIPDRESRRRILGIHARHMPLESDVDLDQIADRTEGFTGADIEDLVRRSGMNALRRDLEVATVTNEDVERALAQTRSSVTPEMEEEYERMAEELSRERPQSRQRIGFGLTEDGRTIETSANGK